MLFRSIEFERALEYTFIAVSGHLPERDLVAFGEQLFRAGDKITFWEMSANRDERVFERPFEFDIARSPNKHLGFGAGVHFCLGAALARLELKIVFEELLRRDLDFELVGAPEYVPNNRLVGLKTLPVRTRRVR